MPTCNNCGLEFKPKRYDRVTFCSRECSFAHKTAERVQREADKEAAERPFSPVWFRSCGACDSPFAARHKLTMYCGKECKERAPWLRQRAILCQEARPECKCAECGKRFVPEFGNKHRRFCSDACGQRSVKRVARRKERARLRQVRVESVDPTKVFDRDRWTCQLCGVKTPRKLRGTIAPRAPELDHIIPLSIGGEHSYRNTQCACRACNLAKSNTPRGQMRLFG